MAQPPRLMPAGYKSAHSTPPRESRRYKIGPHRRGKPAIQTWPCFSVCLRVYSVRGTERDSWLVSKVDLTWQGDKVTRVLNTVSGLLRGVVCHISLLGLPRSINPSFYHHSISLKSISTIFLWFDLGFFGLIWVWGATSLLRLLS